MLKKKRKIKDKFLHIEHTNSVKNKIKTREYITKSNS